MSLSLYKRPKTLLERSHLRRLWAVKNHCGKVIDQPTVYTAAATKPCINVSKPIALIDEKISITVNGLQGKQPITLQTYIKEDENKIFGACGHYIANEDGAVNTFEDASHGGTFDGHEPMGLFWSMRSSPGVKARRILKKDITVPYLVKIIAHSGFLDFSELPWTDDFPSLASSTFYQSFLSPGVKCIPVKEDGLLGTLFLPAGEGPFPAVIDVFGMTGVKSGHRSSLLASNGIASFVIAYVGHEGLATSGEDIDYSYFLKAYDWLYRHPAVDSNAMGGLGSCVGGGYVSLIAWKRPSMKCFVGINITIRPKGPTQMIEGDEVKDYPWKEALIKEIDGALSFRPMSKPEDDMPMLPYWRHGVKALHIQGMDDQCVNPDQVKSFHNSLPEEFKKNIEFITYPGAGHIIEPPHMPLCRMNYNPIFASMLLWGGQSKLHAHAQIDSWPRIVSFFKKHLNVS